MNNKRTKKLLSMLLAIAMVAGLVTVPAASAAETTNATVTYTFSVATDLTGVSTDDAVSAGMFGTKGFFTLGGTITKKNASAVELAKNKGGHIEFKVTGNSATIEATVSSTGGNATSVGMYPYSTDYGTALAGDKATTALTGTTGTTVTYSNVAKGTYRLVCDGSDRGARVLTVKVTETDGDVYCAHANTKGVGGTAATCIAAGKEADTVCDDCGKTIATGKAIDKLGHNFVNGNCDRAGCSATAPDSLLIAEDLTEATSGFDCDYVIKCPTPGKTTGYSGTYGTTTLEKNVKLNSGAHLIFKAPADGDLTVYFADTVPAEGKPSIGKTINITVDGAETPTTGVVGDDATLTLKTVANSVYDIERSSSSDEPRIYALEWAAEAADPGPGTEPTLAPTATPAPTATNDPSTPTATPAPTPGPTAAPAADKVDVWDFGAEQLDAAKFNNHLTVGVINSWYAESVTPGSKTDTFPAAGFTVDGLTFSTNGKTNHKLRTDNTALTRGDSDTSKGDSNDPYVPGEVTYHGNLYSNSSTEPKVNFALECESGDMVTIIVSSNGNASTINFVDADGNVVGTDTFTRASRIKPSTMTFYAKDAGTYKFYSVDEKLVVHRIYREHPAAVTVSGAVTGAGSDAAGLKLVFTNTASGVEAEAAVTGGAYNVELGNYHNGAAYAVSTKGATGVIVKTGAELALTAGAATKTHAVVTDAVVMKNVSGTVAGIDDAAKLAKLQLEFIKPDGKVYQPTVTVTGGAWSAQVESGVTYTVVAKKVNDYTVQTTTVNYTEDKADAVITFEAKPTYAVTIAPDGLEAADLADATLTFTMLNEAGDTEDKTLVPYSDKNVYPYVYTFTGIGAIALRNGTYDVKVVTDKGTQKLTSNLTVNGAAVTKTVRFDTTPEVYSEWSFKDGFGSENWASEVPKIESTTGTWRTIEVDATTGKFNTNGGNYAQFTTGAILKVPVPGATAGQRVKVSVAAYFNGSMTSTLTVGEGDDAVPNTGSNADRDKDIVIETVADNDGYITITSTANDYLTHIKVELVEEDDTIYIKWDFSAEDFTADCITAGAYNTLTFPASTSQKNKTYLLVNPATDANVVNIPVAGDCKITITAYYAANIAIGDQTLVISSDKTDSVEYNYTGGKGTVPVTVNGQTYFVSIVLDYAEGVLPELGDLTFKVGPDKTYKTINAALAAVKAAKRKPGQRAVIEIDPGNYEEMLVITSDDVTLKNASANPSIALTNKGAGIDANAVRITWYYGHGYDYYSMAANGVYDADTLAVNKENGYASMSNTGGKLGVTYWQSSVSVNASGFAAENIIFENSFNQYVSAKSLDDVLVPNSGAIDVVKNKLPADQQRANLTTVGDTVVQNREYVERAAAVGLGSAATGATFDHCAIVGRQDVVYGADGIKAAFYNCDLYGACDYLMGGMTAVFAKCNLIMNISDHKDDMVYITAPQTASGNGFLMYNCTVSSTEPGVNTASAKRAKPGAFGRPWKGDTSEAVFYKTIVEATDPSYFTTDLGSTSLIQPAGWVGGLSAVDNKCNCGEFGTTEWYQGVDNSAQRVSWSQGVLTEEKSPVNGKALTPQAWLGDSFDAFWADKDLTVVTHTPVKAPELPDPDVPGDDVDTTALTEAIAAAEAAKADVAALDADPAGVLNGQEFVSTAVMAALDEAIAKAKAAQPADAAAVAAAVAELNAAVATFQAAIQTGTAAPSGMIRPSTGAAATTTTTTKNEDGSTTKTVTKPDGSVEETTTKPDGTKEVVLTKPDGTIVTTVTEPNGVKTEAVTTAEGETTATVTLPAKVDQAVVAVPKKDVTPGTVAVITNKDGTEEVVKLSVVDEDGLKLLVKGSVSVKLEDRSKQFEDVPAGHWAEEAVDFASSREIFKGTSETTFAPTDKVSRAMMATVLCRLENAAATGTSAFADVAEGTWYSEAVAWANETGVVTGFVDGTFGPDQEITREQLATMLYRYAGLVGLDTTVKGDTAAYPDADSVSGWASEAMAWAVGVGLITGTSDPVNGVCLSPAATASRAEAAIIVERMVKLILQ